MLIVLIDTVPHARNLNTNGKMTVTPVPVYAQADMAFIPGLGPAKEVIPITTFRETMTRVLLSLPKMPQCFSIFQVSEDAVVACDAFGTMPDTLSHAEEGREAYAKQFFVRKSDLDIMPLVSGDVHAMYQFLQGEDTFEAMLYSGNMRQLAPSEFVADIRKLCMDIPCATKEGLRKKLGIAAVSDYELEVAIGWQAYSMVMAPLVLWDLCTDTGSLHLDGYRSMNLEMMGAMTSKACPALTRIMKQLVPWVLTGKSEEAYQQIFNAMMQTIVDNTNVLSVWTYGQMIDANTPCPCGSGKVYDACHGLLLHS